MHEKLVTKMKINLKNTFNTADSPALYFAVVHDNVWSSLISVHYCGLFLKKAFCCVQKEVALMMVECCSQERSYLRFYGLLGQRLCLLNQAWVAVFNAAFQDQYETVHRLETNKLRNVAKFFGQLFYVDALPWTSMSCIHLNEEETNSSR